MVTQLQRCSCTDHRPVASVPPLRCCCCKRVSETTAGLRQPLLVASADAGASVRFISVSTLFVARLAYVSRSWLDERMSMHSCVCHRKVVGLSGAGLRQLILVGRWVVEAGLPIFGLSVAGLRQVILVEPGFLTALAVQVQHQSRGVTATIPGFLTASAVRVHGRRFWWEACLLGPAFAF